MARLHDDGRPAEVPADQAEYLGKRSQANSAQSWYDAGYINVRRRYAHGLSLLANYTYSKSLSNATDFRSRKPLRPAANPGERPFLLQSF